MNQCFDCGIRPVCKVYESFTNYSTIATISITNCSMYNGATPAPPIKQEQKIMQRDPSQLISLSQKIKEATESQQAEEQRAYAECPECEESYAADSFKTCAKCKDTVCPQCAVFYKGKHYCEKCYFEVI